MWDFIGWLNWLNQNSSAAQALLTAGLVVFAAVQGVTAWLARNDTRRLAEAAKAQADANVKMAVETREQRIFATQPLVAIEPGGSSSRDIVLKLRNVGRGPAFNVLCVIKHPAFDMQGKWIKLFALAVGQDTGWLSIPADAGGAEYHESPIEARYQDQYGTWMWCRLKDGNLEVGEAGG